MNLIGQHIQDFINKQWPVIEIPPLTPKVLWLIWIIGLGELAYGFYMYTHEPHAEDFILIMLVPLIFFILRSRLTFLIILISGSVSAAFLALGNYQDVTKVIFLAIMLAFILVNLEYSYLLGIVSLYVFVIPSVQGFSVTHASFVFIAFAYIIIQIEKRESPIFKPTGFTRYLSFFYLWAAFSFIWCKEIPFALYDVVEYSVLFLIFLISVNLVKEEKQLIPIAWTWVIMAFLFSIVKPFVQFPQEAYISSVYGTAETLFSAKNTVSSLINLSLFMLLPLFALDKNVLHRGFLLMAASFMMVVNYMFGSRGGIWSLAFGVFLFYLLLNLKGRAWKRIALKFTSLVVIIGLVVVIPMVPLIMFPLSEIFPFDISDYSGVYSVEFRFDQWRYASQMLEDHGNHLTGLGLGGYKSQYLDYYDFYFPGSPMVFAHPHSYWVYTYTDMGIIGMVILHLFFCIYVWRMRGFLLNTRNKVLLFFGTAVFCGVISYWIHGIVDFGYNEANRLWLFIGIGTAITFMEKKDTKDEEAYSQQEPEQLYVS